MKKRTMDLEQQLDSMEEEMNGTEILIHIPNDSQEMMMKEEHLEHLLEQDDQENEQKMHEELKIQKLDKSAPKKRVSLTIEKKIEIIQRHEQGESQRILSQEYKVGRTTISDILKRKYKFFKFMTMNADKEENLKRRRTLRRTVHKVLEDKLLEWYNESRAQGGYVSGPMIVARAQELHKELGYTDAFTASNGWLDRFKVRNGIKLCGLREVKTECDINAVAPFKLEIEQLANYYNLTLDQIYNADETDLFWRMMPNPESDVNEVKASVRAYRERMTVLCCSNATGSHKLPLVCIGRGKKSRTFNSHEAKTMPVNYFSQETAWMDKDIFKEWFHSHFVPTVRSNLRYHGLPEAAILLIDRSTSHPPDQFLRSEDGNFFCQFFPPKVKSLVQPMEQGIISNVKRIYRRDLLNELISKNQSISEFQKNLSIKDAVRGIAASWEDVAESTIRQGFSKMFPATLDNIQVDLDFTISTPALENLLKQIPECAGYSSERLEKWLSCDDAEPQKDCNISRIDEECEDTYVVFEVPEVHEVHETHQTIEVLNASETTIIEQYADEELMEQVSEQEPEQVQTINQQEAQFEDSDDVSCQQAVNSLEVLLKFMENDGESRYKDVVMLQELRRKLKKRLADIGDMKEQF